MYFIAYRWLERNSFKLLIYLLIYFHSSAPFVIVDAICIRCTLDIRTMSKNMKILTQEDWNVVLFNGMEKTSHWAALYFVALMTFGNYVLFNLLVAILVEGFSSEVNRFVIQLFIGWRFACRYPFTV